MTLARNWVEVPFWSIYQRGKKTGYPAEELLSVYRDYGVVRKTDHDGNRNRPGEDMSVYQLVEVGDLVLNKMKTWQGSLGVSPYRGIVSPAYFVYKPQAEHDSRFLHYALRSEHYIKTYASISKGVRPNQWDLQPEQLDVMGVLLPDRATQQRIADYLDRETGEIDTMIAKLDELAGKLEERKHVAIDVILQRLAPYVNWTPVKFIAQIHTGSGDTQDAKAEGRYPFYVRSQIPQRHDSWEFEGRAVLTAGDGAGVGKVFHLVDGRFMAHQRVYVITQFKGVSARYFYYLFRHLFPAVARDGSAKATVDSIRHRMIADLPMPVPTPAEQERIADHLDEVTSRIDTMLAKVSELKSLLVERRAALITDVVTGRKEVA